MTARRHTPRQVLLVAGGIGITPMRALFETLDVAGPDLTLLYRASTPADIVFGRELAEIASRRGARLVYLIGSSTDPANAVTGDALARLVSDLAAHDVYLCASPRFAAAGRAGLRPAGVLRHQLHEEISPSDASNAQATGTQKLRRPAQQEHSRSTAGTTRLAEVSNFLAARQSAPAPLVYLLVAALVFGESSILLGLVLPGETALLTGGVLASTGHASLAPLLVIAVVAAVAGDAVGYWIGRRVGTATRHPRVGRWVGQGRWDRAQRLMSEHGRLAVVAGDKLPHLHAAQPAGWAALGRWHVRGRLPAGRHPEPHHDAGGDCPRCAGCRRRPRPVLPLPAPQPTRSCGMSTTALTPTRVVTSPESEHQAVTGGCDVSSP